MAKRLVVVGVGVLIVGLGMGLAWFPSGGGNCYSPFFVNTNYGLKPSSVDSLIHQTGGLPKSNSEVMDGLSLSPSARVYPVASWEIKNVTVSDSESLWNRVRDDDPTYNIEVEVQVRYADGSEGTLRWRTWRYGLLVCPLVVGYGDGPPGRSEWIEPRPP